MPVPFASSHSHPVLIFCETRPFRIGELVRCNPIHTFRCASQGNLQPPDNHSLSHRIALCLREPWQRPCLETQEPLQNTQQQFPAWPSVCGKGHRSMVHWESLPCHLRCTNPQLSHRHMPDIRKARLNQFVAVPCALRSCQNQPRWHFHAQPCAAL